MKTTIYLYCNFVVWNHEILLYCNASVFKKVQSLLHEYILPFELRSVLRLLIYNIRAFSDCRVPLSWASSTRYACTTEYKLCAAQCFNIWHTISALIPLTWVNLVIVESYNYYTKYLIQPPSIFFSRLSAQCPGEEVFIIKDVERD